MWQSIVNICLVFVLFSATKTTLGADGSKVLISKRRFAIANRLAEQVESEKTSDKYVLPQQCILSQETSGKERKRKIRQASPGDEGRLKGSFATLIGNSTDKICAATFVNPDIILTAKSCVDQIQKVPGELRFVLGDSRRSFIEFNGKVVWTYNYCADRLYSLNQSINGVTRSYLDVMVVKIDEKLNYSDKINPICLGSSSFEMLKRGETDCRLVGQTGEFGEEELPLINSWQVEYRQCWFENESQFCFSFTNKNDQVCMKNSGGAPIACLDIRIGQWFLVGIVSTVQESCQVVHNHYNVATKMDFVKKNKVTDDCIEELSL